MLQIRNPHLDQPDPLGLPPYAEEIHGVHAGRVTLRAFAITGNWMLATEWQPSLRRAWRYRGLVAGAVWRELRAQSMGSLLGLAWLVLQPAAMVALYTLVFAKVMGARLPGTSTGGFDYSVYLCAGLLPWQWWADGVQRLQGVFVRHANLLKKAAFPRLTLVAVELGVSTVQFALVAGVFLLFWLTSGTPKGWAALAALPALAVQLALMAGLGVLLGVLHVFFRDVGQALGVGLVFWFWLTPIVYPLQVLPAWAQGWVLLNPMTTLVQFYQAALYDGRWPAANEWWRLVAVATLALGLLALAWKLYRSRAAEMVDEL